MFSWLNNPKKRISGKRIMYPAAGCWVITCCVAHLYRWRNIPKFNIATHNYYVSFFIFIKLTLCWPCIAA